MIVMRVVGHDAFVASRLRHLQDVLLVLMQIHYQDDGDADAAAVWRYLGETPLWTETAEFAADEDNPLTATLDGELQIAIRHVDDRIAEAKLAKLRLVRERDDSDAWFLPAAEVERTAKLAGLTRPPKKAISVVFLAVLVLAAAALLLIGTWLVAWRLRP